VQPPLNSKGVPFRQCRAGLGPTRWCKDAFWPCPRHNRVVSCFSNVFDNVAVGCARRQAQGDEHLGVRENHVRMSLIMGELVVPSLRAYMPKRQKHDSCKQIHCVLKILHSRSAVLFMVSVANTRSHAKRNHVQNAHRRGRSKTKTVQCHS